MTNLLKNVYDWYLIYQKIDECEDTNFKYFKKSISNSINEISKAENNKTPSLCLIVPSNCSIIVFLKFLHTNFKKL